MGRTSRSWRNLEEAAVVFILTCTDPIACEPNALGGHVSPGIPHVHHFPAHSPGFPGPYWFAKLNLG